MSHLTWRQDCWWFFSLVVWMHKHYTRFWKKNLCILSLQQSKYTLLLLCCIWNITYYLVSKRYIQSNILKLRRRFQLLKSIIVKKTWGIYRAWVCTSTIRRLIDEINFFPEKRRESLKAKWRKMLRSKPAFRPFTPIFCSWNIQNLGFSNSGEASYDIANMS